MEGNMAVKLSSLKSLYVKEKIHEIKSEIVFKEDEPVLYSRKFIDCSNLDYESITTKYHLISRVFFKRNKDGALREVRLKYGLFIDLNYLFELSEECNFSYGNGMYKQSGFDLALYSIEIISPKYNRPVSDILIDDIHNTKNLTIHKMLKCFPDLKYTQNYPNLISTIKKIFAFKSCCF
jgi:hypothetical protein